jgi:hypothetical protein
MRSTENRSKCKETLFPEGMPDCGGEQAMHRSSKVHPTILMDEADGRIRVKAQVKERKLI